MSMKQSKKDKSFMIVIKDTQNASWQGTIEWLDQNKKQHFRSALEMIKLIDSAVENDSQT
ncbi:hypothetical protein F300043A5_07100 [Massilimicrobiota timonensis]|uniref:Uncharacterized protein n=2 Tax=Bacillota TaxID=1239 RepID=A0A1Y4SU44_9FIRM|nr:hypothetical protein B5E75_10405 [Massilimicrobiota timonensis]